MRRALALFVVAALAPVLAVPARAGQVPASHPGLDRLLAAPSPNVITAVAVVDPSAKPAHQAAALRKL